MTRERIETWVKSQFAPPLWERVIADLIDVASGNRDGNAFERDAIRRIFN
jgi:hypothetical protein